ncbi:hypothetical protein HY312_04020, partial [Candidatus Saccharibacteria bacterium]|nr:hypothetical protein [Candidatus Saccharibacteria bacterium]
VEAVDAPVPHTRPPQPQSSGVSDSIDGRSGSSYIEPGNPAKFDAPVDSYIEGSDGTPDQYVDPFSTPLPDMPDLRESKGIEPVSPPENVVADPDPQSLTLDQLEKTTVPTLPALDLPPLPPLPDFSNTNLPPLPPPPPPPIFDQSPTMVSAPPQSGAVSSDNLGDIFGDAPAAPEVPQTPPTPPKPGQFQIPGQ